MSDAPGTAHEPLWMWSDDTIVNLVYQLTYKVTDASALASIRGLLYAMRQSYQVELASRDARIAELTAQLAEANRWVPNVMSYQSGVLSTLIETANAPSEVIWDEILKDDDAPRPHERRGRWRINAT